LRTLMRMGATTRAVLARQAGLSAPTVSTVVDALRAAGVAVEVGPGPDSGGRRGYLVRLVPTARTTACLDLSPTKPVFALLDLEGNVVHESLRPIPAQVLRNPLHLAQWLPTAVGGARLLGIGVAVPGVTDSSRGVVEWAPTLQWRDVQLGAHLEQVVPGVLVLVDNDLNLAALGEYALAPEERGDMAMLGLRPGMGAGIVLNGELYRGRHFAAGEVGYLVASAGQLREESLEYGSLETLILSREAAADAAWQEEVTDLLAIACIALGAVLDVDTIVLSQEIVASIADIRERATLYVRRHVPHPPRVIESQLGDHAALRGAARAVVQHLGTDLARLIT
jgi:predicted NBD/HSP70 family sugar kinase